MYPAWQVGVSAFATWQMLDAIAAGAPFFLAIAMALAFMSVFANDRDGTPFAANPGRE